MAVFYVEALCLVIECVPKNLVMVITNPGVTYLPSSGSVAINELGLTILLKATLSSA